MTTDSDTPRSERELLSGAPLFTFGADMRIRSWNRAAEKLTGIPAGEVVGRSCWEALCAHDEAGDLVCHTGCSFHRLLTERRSIAPPTLVIKTSTGTRRAYVPMVVVEDRTLFAALLLDPGETVAASTRRTDGEAPPELTPRQMTVLRMLAEGKQARKIAAELHLSEATVRNHIRAILRGFGCNSQLAATAKARRLGLV